MVESKCLWNTSCLLVTRPHAPSFCSFFLLSSSFFGSLTPANLHSHQPIAIQITQSDKMSPSVWLFLYLPHVPPPFTLPFFPSHHSGVPAWPAQLPIFLYLDSTMAGFVEALELWHPYHQDQRVQSFGLVCLRTQSVSSQSVQRKDRLLHGHSFRSKAQIHLVRKEKNNDTKCGFSLKKEEDLFRTNVVAIWSIWDRKVMIEIQCHITSA